MGFATAPPLPRSQCNSVRSSTCGRVVGRSGHTFASNRTCVCARLSLQNNLKEVTADGQFKLARPLRRESEVREKKRVDATGVPNLLDLGCLSSRTPHAPHGSYVKTGRA